MRLPKWLRSFRRRRRLSPANARLLIQAADLLDAGYAHAAGSTARAALEMTLTATVQSIAPSASLGPCTDRCGRLAWMLQCHGLIDEPTRQEIKRAVRIGSCAAHGGDANPSKIAWLIEFTSALAKQLNVDPARSGGW